MNRYFIVMPGRDPGIHGAACEMDPRIKSGGDEFVFLLDGVVGSDSMGRWT